MPTGMLLRSPWPASHLSDPQQAFTLDTYRKQEAHHFAAPVPLDRFVGYGRWFQRQAVPNVDPRSVVLVEPSSQGFSLTLQDGSPLNTRRVVVAAGIAPFAVRPAAFSNLPLSMVSHSSEEKDLSRFAGKQVVVVGAGQSALESAVLLKENGADVELLVRDRIVRWLGQKVWLHTWPIKPMLYAPADVGPAVVSHFVARPNWFRRLPRQLQDRLGPRAIRPAGAGWLKKRFDVEQITFQIGKSVVSSSPQGRRVKITLDDRTERIADHVLLGTGYQVDIARYPFLSRKLLDSMNRIEGYPQLDAGFESSVPGLHFVGAPAAWSFGPLMRFVAGTQFASRAIAKRCLRNV
jgi:cation diffusion facilitator CzcD-associated flavoprotein CzcO